jgi:hypothetical protein
MSSSTITFSGPQIIREYATDRTKKPKFSLDNMQAQFDKLTWSSMGVTVNGNNGTASMNNMRYNITNQTTDPNKHHTRMDVFVDVTNKHFVFTSKSLLDSTGAIVLNAKDLELTIYKDNNKARAVVIQDLLPEIHYILFVDDNFDIYCTSLCV